jgi:hypothetical protein
MLLLQDLIALRSSALHAVRYAIRAPSSAQRARHRFQID